MRVLRKNKEINDFLQMLNLRASGADSSVEHTVRTILQEVKNNGDKAVLKFTRKFDFRKARKIRLGASEIKRHAGMAHPEVVKSLAVSARRIRRFHEHQRDFSWSFTERESILGQIVRPLNRVGVYIPGGTAAYPSTVLMNVIPAQVAGVKEIAACVPSVDGHINPAVMAAIAMLGVREVYSIGGAQAIGALAYGTDTIERVDKIVGPGNVYVATAKKMVFGIVDIDMIAGPSEILIIADSSAPPAFVASDLLSQAEHDQMASSVLLTNSAELAESVSREITSQLTHLQRRSIAEASLEKYGAIIITKTLEEALRISNRVAPEHLEIMTKNPIDLVPSVENAGAIFLGPWTPEALGDYAAGPNHTLPTGGTARFSSPLGVYDFLKRSSLLGFTRKGFIKISKTIETVAESEGLDAHAGSIRIRKRIRNNTTTLH